MATVATTFFDSVKMIAAEKGIPEEDVFEAVEEALAKAADKYFQAQDFYGNFQAQMDRETGEFHVYALKQVVAEVEEEDLEISLAEAQALNPDAAEGDTLWLPQDTSQLGRIAAQAAKQVLVQKVREAERERIFTEFADRIGEVVVAEVKRFEKSAIILEIDRVEAMLRAARPCAATASTRASASRSSSSSVDTVAKDPQVQVSRTDPRLLIKLFENEVPEIHDGTVVIRNCVREAGDRAKVAVHSLDPDVDPVGACVGLKGSRVQAIIRELKNEKIDIVRYDEDASPLHRQRPEPRQGHPGDLVRPRDRRVEVVVDDEQLSIAIGKRGQNVRLAAKLTGWNIDVRSEADKRREAEVAMGAGPAGHGRRDGPADEAAAPASTLLDEIRAVEGLDEAMAEKLAAAGYPDAKSLYTVTAEQLMQVDGMDQDLAFRSSTPCRIVSESRL